MLTRKQAQKLMEIKGEARGMVLKADWDFVLEEKGEEGLRKVEARMAELGYPLKYKEIKPMDFYPMGLAAISVLSIKEVFNFKEKDLEKWGHSVVKFSTFMKIFMKYFGSLKLIANQIPKIWREHYTVGDLEMPDFSKEKRYAILKEKNFPIHPIYCNIHKAYFIKVAQMVIKSPVSCKETKCMFKGDSHHEFLLTW